MFNAVVSCLGFYIFNRTNFVLIVMTLCDYLGFCCIFGFCVYKCSFSTQIFVPVFRSLFIIRSKEREKQHSLMQQHATIWIEHLTHVLCCVVLCYSFHWHWVLVNWFSSNASHWLCWISLPLWEREIRHMYFGLLFAQGIYYL